jgi:chemotaxis protein methyltransferase CheR
MAISKAEFDYLRSLIKEHSAIILEDGKEYLVEMRLMSLARIDGFANVGALILDLKAKPFGEAHRKVIDAMTTNETSFFRDLHPFETLKNEVIPEFLKKRATSKQLNIWFAACSSGQEPYSVAMMLNHNFPQLSSWRLNLTAGDLSRLMLEKCRLGIYSQLEINRGLPAPLLIKYFKKDDAAWQIKEEIRRMIKFSELNLTKNWVPMPAMDIVFIRNVLIYFNMETKKAIFAKIRKVLKPDGILFLGGAETTLNIDDNFERVQSGRTVYYKLKGN